MQGSEYNKFVKIGEHTVVMPPLTNNKSEVLFVDAKDGYWDRESLLRQYKQIWFDFIPYHSKLFQEVTLYDQDNILISLNNEDSSYIIRIYEQEMRRRRDGVFFKNGKEIVWLTGFHYFILMWCKTKRPDKKGDWFDFRYYQLHYSYLIHHTNISEQIWGGFFSKAKKTGITNFHWLYYLDKATRTKNINMANMNLDQDKGAKTFRDHFLYAYNGLPMALKAQWKSKSEQEGRITFGKLYNNSKKNRLIMNDAEDELNTTVMCVPTMSHAFDVDVFEDIWYDEPPKYKSDFGEIYRSNNAGTSLQDFMAGKIWLTSYTPDESGTSFLSARDLFLDSELRTIKEGSNGQTKSKLICHHLPAFQSWMTSFDKYGVCDEADAMRKIQFGRDQLKDRPKELQGEIRKFANTKKEAWSTGGAGSAFDNIRLGDLLSDIELDESSSPETPYVEGKLKWTNELWEIGLFNRRPRGQFCPVKFVPLTKEEMARCEVGKLRQYQEIPLAHQNMALRMGRDEDDLLLPPHKFLYCLGGDPTSQAAASEVIQGSKNAFYTMSRRDDALDSLFGRIMTGIINLEYFARPEIANEAYEDLVKQIIYTGSLCAVEANVPTWATWLMEEGLGHYMLIRNENGVPAIWKRYMGLPQEEDKKYSLIRTTGNQDNKTMIEHFMTLAKNYFYKPEVGAKDYGKVIRSARLIKQCMDLNPMDTKLFDLFMGWGYSLWCNDIYSNILLTPDEDLFSSYNIGSVLAALYK